MLKNKKSYKLNISYIKFSFYLALLFFLRIDLVFANNTPTGGDMGAHVVAVNHFVNNLFPQLKIMGWTNIWFAGVPLFYFYFPLAFAATLFILYQQIDTSIRRVSRCLVLASLLLPGGFFLGGIQVYDADPGIGVWLVPLGAFFLLAGVLVTAMGTTNSQD